MRSRLNRAVYLKAQTVTILAAEDGEVFELNSSDEAAILATIAEAERGEVINASDVLGQINNA